MLNYSNAAMNLFSQMGVAMEGNDPPKHGDLLGGSTIDAMNDSIQNFKGLKNNAARELNKLSGIPTKFTIPNVSAKDAVKAEIEKRKTQLSTPVEVPETPAKQGINMDNLASGLAAGAGGIGIVGALAQGFIKDEKTSNTVGDITSGIAGAGSLTAGILTMNPMMIAQGATSLVSTISGVVNRKKAQKEEKKLQEEAVARRANAMAAQSYGSLNSPIVHQYAQKGGKLGLNMNIKAELQVGFTKPITAHSKKIDYNSLLNNIVQ